MSIFERFEKEGFDKSETDSGDILDAGVLSGAGSIDKNSPLKVIFLDIDGVLCLHSKYGQLAATNDNSDYFSPDCCRRLREIMDATGAKLVLSSAWRIDAEDRKEVVERLLPYGITKYDFIGVTPDLNTNRSAEILYFLQSRPQIYAYVVLDDDPIGDNIPQENVVYTRIDTGITREAVVRSISILEKPRLG